MPAKLRSAIKQRKPFDSLEQEAFLMLVRVSGELSAEQAELFRSAGITWTQYNALRILRGAGGEALSCGEIGERMIARDADVTRLLDRLEKAGLVQRARDDRDRRVVKTRITDRGLGLLDELATPVAEMHQRQLGHLGESKLRKLLALLEDASSPAA